MSSSRSEYNLLVRLASYSPRPDRTALEDFSTECLAWLLRHSNQLRQCFLRAFQVGDVNADWTVQTQVPEKAGNDLGRSRFDLVLVDHPGTTALVIECKVDSLVRPQQLTRYREQARKRWDATTVGLLGRNTKEFASIDEPKATWGAIYRMLGELSEASPEVDFVTAMFRQFMEENQMHDPRIEPLKGELSNLQEFLRQVDELEPLAIHVAKVALRLKRKSQAKRKFISGSGSVWIGTLPNLSELEASFSDLWLGFRVHEQEGLLRTEAYLEAKVPSARARELLKNVEWVQKEPTDFPSRALQLPTNGMLRSDIENWFTDQLKQLLEITSTKAKPRGNSKRKPEAKAPRRAA